MAGPRSVPIGVDITAPFMLAANHCDQAADDLIKLSDKVYNLEAAVAEAWKGGAAGSLTNSLVDKATLILNAAGVLRGAAAALRRGGTQLARAQYEAYQRSTR
jgi:hypothetical protein